MKSKILIVGGKEQNLSTLEKLLKQDSNILIHANSGSEAIRLTLEHEFAVALIDVQISGKDGINMVKQLRSVERTRLLPVIFISDRKSEYKYLIQGIKEGGVDYLMKPIIPEILLGKVKIFFDLHGQRKRLEKEIAYRIEFEKKLRKTEKKLREAKRSAEASDKLKSAFLANMSHEIRTPLNAIIGFSNLLANSSLTEKDRLEYMQYVNNSSNALMKLIDDILDVAKIEAGQLKLKYETVSVEEVMKELYMTFNQQRSVRGREAVKLVYEGSSARNVVFKADGLRLKQILSNLLMNALKFTESGKIAFGYSLSLPDTIEFYVHDTGVGIPEEKLQKIFDRFEQVEHPSLLDSSGAGIGLAIVQKLVRMLGGHVEVRSEAGFGTQFIVKLPYIPVEALKENPKKEPLTNKEVRACCLKKNILIAEDEYINFQFIKEILRDLGATLYWAKNGQEAIELFHSIDALDLVLMDIKMPVKTGYEALFEIKKANKDIPVIAQTAFAMAGEKEDCKKAGFDDYIPKPIDRTIFYEKLYKFLKTSKKAEAISDRSA